MTENKINKLQDERTHAIDNTIPTNLGSAKNSMNSTKNSAKMRNSTDNKEQFRYQETTHEQRQKELQKTQIRGRRLNFNITKTNEGVEISSEFEDSNELLQKNRRFFDYKKKSMDPKKSKTIEAQK